MSLLQILHKATNQHIQKQIANKAMGKRSQEGHTIMCKQMSSNINAREVITLHICGSHDLHDHHQILLCHHLVTLGKSQYLKWCSCGSLCKSTKRTQSRATPQELIHHAPEPTLHFKQRVQKSQKGGYPTPCAVVACWLQISASQHLAPTVYSSPPIPSPPDSIHIYNFIST